MSFTTVSYVIETVAIGGKLHPPSPLSSPLETPTTYAPPLTQHDFFSTSFTNPPFKGILIGRYCGINIMTKNGAHHLFTEFQEKGIGK